MGFFKAYDMRGTYGVDFDLTTVYRVGRALPRVVKGTRWLVGRDCRTTGDEMRDALVKGLVAAGAAVFDLCRCSTPMTYYFIAADDYDGAVMITASHNPPSDNGLKVSRRGALPVGYAAGLDQVERLVAADTAELPVGPVPPVTSVESRTSGSVPCAISPPSDPPSPSVSQRPGSVPCTYSSSAVEMPSPSRSPVAVSDGSSGQKRSDSWGFRIED